MQSFAHTCVQRPSVVLGWRCLLLPLPVVVVVVVARAPSLLLVRVAGGRVAADMALGGAWRDTCSGTDSERRQAHTGRRQCTVRGVRS